MRLTQWGPSADTGKLRPFFLGDAAHTGLDNITFLDKNHVAAVEDAGATAHAQRNALDSAYSFTINGGSGAPDVVRFSRQRP